MEEESVASVQEEETTPTLPLHYVSKHVLFPEETLPLHIYNPHVINTHTHIQFYRIAGFILFVLQVPKIIKTIL